MFPSDCKTQREVQKHNAKYKHSITREKEGDLTQSYDKTPYTNRRFENQRTTHKRHQKLRLHNDCGPT